jgi:hypothetical protein
MNEGRCPLTPSAKREPTSTSLVVSTRASGFEVVGRSEDDGDGQPFPLLHMRDTAYALQEGRSVHR